MKILFWLSLAIAVLHGTATLTEISAMSSDNPAPEVAFFLNWPCGDEECFWNITTGSTGHTVP